MHCELYWKGQRRRELDMGLMAKRQLLAGSLVATGCDWFLHRMRAWRGLLVLNYHRIGNPNGTPWDHDLWSAQLNEFDWQLGFLKSHFDLIGLNDLESASKDRRGRFVMISFDDGYRDNYLSAFPVLRSHGVPAAFFLATGFLDKPHISWWDEVAWMIHTSTREFLDGHGWLPDPLLINRLDPQVTVRALLKIYKNLTGSRTRKFLDWLGQETGRGRCPVSNASKMWMTWDMVREMHAAGMTIGAHTVTHPILSRISPEEQKKEITDSCRRIEAEIGRPVHAFSYPVGGTESCGPQTPQILRDAGITWAFRFGIGFQNDSFKDPLQIPRLAVEQTDTRTMFRAITSLPQLFD